MRLLTFSGLITALFVNKIFQRQRLPLPLDVIQQLAGKALSPSEESWLCVHIAARQIQEIAPSAINADDDEARVNYILRYINTH